MKIEWPSDFTELEEIFAKLTIGLCWIRDTIYKDRKLIREDNFVLSADYWTNTRSHNSQLSKEHLKERVDYMLIAESEGIQTLDEFQLPPERKQRVRRFLNSHGYRC